MLQGRVRHRTCPERDLVAEWGTRIVSRGGQPDRKRQAVGLESGKHLPEDRSLLAGHLLSVLAVRRVDVVVRSPVVAKAGVYDPDTWSRSNQLLCPGDRELAPAAQHSCCGPARGQHPGKGVYAIDTDSVAESRTDRPGDVRTVTAHLSGRREKHQVGMRGVVAVVQDQNLRRNRGKS